MKGGSRTLKERREMLCEKFITELKPDNPLFNLVKRGRDKTWGRPWPRPWCRPWPTYGLPMAYLWPTLNFRKIVFLIKPNLAKVVRGVKGSAVTAKNWNGMKWIGMKYGHQSKFSHIISNFDKIVC